MLALGIGASAQLQLGSGTSITSSSDAIPWSNYYKFSYCQQIIKKTELNTTAGNITGLRFFLGSTATLLNSNEIVVYLGHTPNDTFATSTSWVPISSLTQVFAGTVTNNNGMVDVTFTTPFAYNNVDNLVVAIDENKDGYDTAGGTSEYFYKYSVASNSSLYYRNDTTNPDPAAPTITGTQSGYRSVMQVLGLTPASPPACSAISAPAVGATGVSLTPTFSWATASGATSYVVNLGTTPGGNNIMNNVDVGLVTSYTVPAASQLSYMTTYYLTVSPKNTMGVATGCTERSFITKTIPCPTVSAPSSSATNVSRTPVFTWTASDAATGYRISIGTTTGGTDVMNNMDVGNVTTYTYNGTPLNYNTKYYYTVNSYSGALTSSSCTERNFTTLTLCPTVSAPSSSATGVAVKPTFTWASNAEATGYKISIGTTSGGTDVLNGFDVGNVLTYTLPNELNYNTKYYYTINSYNATNTSVGCSERTFTTLSICPTVSAPAASAAAVSLTPTFTWSAVTGVSGYKLRIGTTPGAADVLNNADVGNVTTYTLPTPLNNSTIYYYSIGAYTATQSSTNCTERSFSTICSATNAPYAQNFDTTATGSSTNTNAPLCWSYVETANSAGYGYVSSTSPNTSPNCYYLYNSSDTTGNIMLVSPQTTNLTDGTRQVRFMAKGGSTGYTLQVGTLSNPSNPASFTAVGSSISLTSSWASYLVTIPAGSDQYLAIKHGLGGSARGIYLDDVFVEKIPTCIEPTALTVGTITPNSANLSWTASTTPPAGGYDVYYSTSNTAPTSAANPNINGVPGLSTPLSSLAPSTTYYVWVRSHCSGTDMSVWSLMATFRTLCQPPALLSATPATICGASGTATISATADAGATISWYDSNTAVTPLGTGNSYTTPVISSTTTYYVSAKNNSAVGVVGPVNPSTFGSISSSNYDINMYYQIFDVASPITLYSIDVFPTSSAAIGTSSAIEIKNNAGVTLLSVPYTVAVNDGTTPQTINLNYALPAGTGYRIGQGAGVQIYLNRNTDGANYPITSGVVSVTGNSFSSGPNYWYYIYNWKFSSGCESARQPVVVTVDSACLGTSEVAGKDNSIKVYPNPFTDTLTISDVSKVQSVSVIDLAGRLVKTIENPSSVLQLRDLKEGMYLVVLNMKDGTKQTVKAIKK